MQNKKAESGAIRNSFRENFTSGDDLAFSVEDYAKKSPEFQQSLTDVLSKHQTVRRLFSCFICGKSYSLKKMTNCPAFCRNCRDNLRSKGRIAQNNFIERAKANVGKFLREVAR